MVEHTIGMPEIENEWNDWYAGYLQILLAVPGIESAQRFTVRGSKPSRYMAMYTIESGDVFESAPYKASGGGGSASARFRPAYQSWTRILFEAADGAPFVRLDQVLVTADRATPGDAPFEWLPAVGLHKTTPFRGLAVLTPAEAARVATAHDGGSTIYTPLTSQLLCTLH